MHVKEMHSLDRVLLLRVRLKLALMIVVLSGVAVLLFLCALCPVSHHYWAVIAIVAMAMMAVAGTKG